MKHNKRYEKEDLFQLTQSIKKGGVGLFPTDTIWGLGCDAFNAGAVAKIHEIKQRPVHKKYIVLCKDDRDILSLFSSIPDQAWDLWRIATSPLTLVLPNPDRAPKHLVSQDNFLAVRMVEMPFISSLIGSIGKPIISTSANLSGSEETPRNYSEVHEEIKLQCDYVAEYLREERMTKASSIIKLDASGTVNILRK